MNSYLMVMGDEKLLSPGPIISGPKSLGNLLNAPRSLSFFPGKSECLDWRLRRSLITDQNELFLFDSSTGERLHKWAFEDSHSTGEGQDFEHFASKRDQDEFDEFSFEVLALCSLRIDQHPVVVVSLRKENEKHGTLHFLQLDGKPELATLELPTCATSLLWIPRDDLPASSPFRNAYCLLMIGTKGGHCYALDVLLDLNRPRSIKTPKILSSFDDYEPSYFVRTVGSNFLPFVSLDPTSHLPEGIFVFPPAPHPQRSQLPEKGVSVTAFHYSSSLGALLVGFNFGCFQMWSMHSGTHIYSSTRENQINISKESPVTHFAFHGGFLWVGRSTSTSPFILTKTFPGTLSIFRMYFNVPQPNSILSLKEIRPGPIMSLSQSPSQIFGLFSLDSEYILIVWEQLSSPSEIFVAILKSSDFSQNQQISPFSPFSVPLLKKYCEGYLLDCWIEPASTVVRNKTESPSNGLAFSANFLFENAVVSVRFFSKSEFALALLNQEGPSRNSLMACLQAQLISPIHDLSNLDQDLPSYFLVLYDLMLKHRMLGVLSRHVLKKNTNKPPRSFQTFDDSEYELANPRPVLEWAWGLFEQHLVPQISQYSQLLFSQQAVSTTPHRALFSTLMDLVSLFTALLSRDDCSEEGRISLEEKYDRIALQAQHLELIIWFHDHSLLPDLYTNHLQKELSKFYQTQRNFSNVGLFIDQLVKLYASDTIESYPPSSLSKFLNLFQSGSLNQENNFKHEITIYFLNDLQEYFNPSSNFVQLYATHFLISGAKSKMVEVFRLLDRLTEEASLDSQILDLIFDSEVLALLDSNACLRVLQILNERKAFDFSLQFLRVVEMRISAFLDPSLKIKILLSNFLLQEAFLSIRSISKSIVSIDEPLLRNLFHLLFVHCLQTKNMPFFLQLPFDATEDKLLVEFLSNQSELTDQISEKRQFLFLYLVQRHRFMEAIAVHEMSPTSHPFQQSLAENIKLALPAFQSVASHVGSLTLLPNQNQPQGFKNPPVRLSRLSSSDWKHLQTSSFEQLHTMPFTQPPSLSSFESLFPYQQSFSHTDVPKSASLGQLAQMPLSSSKPIKQEESEKMEVESAVSETPLNSLQFLANRMRSLPASRGKDYALPQVTPDLSRTSVRYPVKTNNTARQPAFEMGDELLTDQKEEIQENDEMDEENDQENEEDEEEMVPVSTYETPRRGRGRPPQQPATTSKVEKTKFSKSSQKLPKKKEVVSASKSRRSKEEKIRQEKPPSAYSMKLRSFSKSGK